MNEVAFLTVEFRIELTRARERNVPLAGYTLYESFITLYSEHQRDRE